MASILRDILRKPSAPEVPPAIKSFKVLPPQGSEKPPNSPRILVIGAGSRGSAYARAIHTSTIGTVVGVAEPIEYKRNLFVSKYNLDTREEGLIFSSWTEIVENEAVIEKVKREVDGFCICTLDETHAEVRLPLHTSDTPTHECIDCCSSSSIEHSHPLREATQRNTRLMHPNPQHRYLSLTPADSAGDRPRVAVFSA